MMNYGTSTILDLDTIPESPVKEEGNTLTSGVIGVDGEGGGGGGGGGGGSGGGGNGAAAPDACCGGHGVNHGHSHQKKISLDVMEEGKEAEYLFEAVKAG